MIPADSPLNRRLLGSPSLLLLLGTLPGAKSGGTVSILVTWVRLLLKVCSDLLLGVIVWLSVRNTGT